MEGTDVTRPTRPRMPGQSPSRDRSVRGSPLTQRARSESPSHVVVGSGVARTMSPRAESLRGTEHLSDTIDTVEHQSEQPEATQHHERQKAHEIHANTS